MACRASHTPMGLRKGDRLTISRGAVIHLTQYDSLKPYVSLTRELSDDPEADRSEMERICYVELRRAVLAELRSRRKAEKLMGDEMKLTPLLKHCEEVIQRGYDEAPEGDGFPKGSGEKQTARVERGSRREGRRRKDG